MADLHTPVGLYLKLRDHYQNVMLLESSEYQNRENSHSYICLEPLAAFRVQKEELLMTTPVEEIREPVPGKGKVMERLHDFMTSFEYQSLQLPFVTNGLFGYTTFSGVQHFEDIHFASPTAEHEDIPLLLYNVFRYVLVVDHFKNEMHLLEHTLTDQESGLDRLEGLLNNYNIPAFHFTAVSGEQSNMDDATYCDLVERARTKCHRGDVYQMVVSRSFSQSFEGDEFNVYRALRSINPSPYLFYFDYGSFKIFGSSPESQLTVRDGAATIHPIAGTYKRQGDPVKDRVLARQLAEDPKENAEHVMLVDLARNDLSRHASEVEVVAYRQVQYFSHVIHLVSEVSGQVRSTRDSLRILADTFPAGTLSGAPKLSAMQAIDELEPQRRTFYGGMIGFIGFDGTVNHAIIIRSMLSKANRLIYQAGAGVVFESHVENELQEVNNKVAALRLAIQEAQKI